MKTTENMNHAIDSSLREFHGAVEGLMEIVEGFRGERWSSNGKRLVDTKEWRRLYVARCDVNRKSDAMIAVSEANK